VTSPATRHGSRLHAQPLRFTFDGCSYPGVAGDTAASALLANGVRLMGRSVKYRRRRGLLAAGPEEPNALFTVGARPAVIPNVPAPLLQLRDGLELRSQNRWPTLRFDLASALQAGGGLFGAGFYYKTFIWPAWRWYETPIRHLAGLGEAPGRCDLPSPVVEHCSCDVVVAGAGAAGLAAALAAARAGARVIVCEREPACGGELEYEDAQVGGKPAREWVRAALGELAALGARVLTQTTLVAESGGQLLAHGEPGGLPGMNTLHYIRPRAFVIAMGAVEYPIVFRDNDLPGVMLLGAAERYLARYGARCGQDLVLFANNDRAYPAAQRLLAGGMRVRAIVDTRAADATGMQVAALRDELRRAGVECLATHAVLAAEGSGEVRGARVAPLADPAAARQIPCDTILVSGGWAPALHAGLREGGSPEFQDALGAFIATAQPTGRAPAGAANGHLELAQALRDGHEAGVRAARAAGAPGAPGEAPAGRGDAEPRIAPFARSPAAARWEKHQFIDLQNDVTVADVRTALAEGLVDIEHLKRYTTLGVGTEQGRTSGLLGAAILAELRSEALPGIGVSRTRPPYHPLAMRSIAGFHAGDAVKVARRTPLHDWHEAHGGVLDPMDLWLRPRFYRANGGSAFAAAIAEARQVRRHGGIADGSTLGKLEVAGPDAAAFLDYLYLNRASTIKAGRARYMVNLREDGCVLDDGLVLRLGAERFIATVSSSHGPHMLAHFEHYRATEFAGRRLTVTDVTEAWATLVVAGPASRAALENVLAATWRDALGKLEHMGFADGEHGGDELRLLRASFSGELAYELHCRPAIAVELWQALCDAGLAPYGLDAVDILRVEKGYLVSSEINGETTPLDLGLDALVRAGNPCLGRELLDRPAFHEPHRPRLVGLRAADGRASFLGGAQLTLPEETRHPCGYVTSSVYSPTLDEWLGLALVARSIDLETRLVARDPLRGSEVAVRVVPPVHFDPDGTRMKGQVAGHPGAAS
jgi:heterotetrameric sarcosine oxidase alpha subunit